VYEGARKFSFPPDLLAGEHDAVLLCVPVPVLPYFRRFFAQQQSPYIWKTRADYDRAYPVFAAIEAQMTASCLSDLVESNNRLYRLLDTSLNGTLYEVSELLGLDGNPIINPPIPTIPPAGTTAPNALRAQVARLRVLAENTAVGATAPAGAGLDGAPALADDSTARQLLRRLTVGIDGNDTPAPGDNLLAALRGQVPADAERNVIDKIIALDKLIAEIKALLQ
jgi:hypothetical protein